MADHVTIDHSLALSLCRWINQSIDQPINQLLGEARKRLKELAVAAPVVAELQRDATTAVSHSDRQVVVVRLSGRQAGRQIR